MDASVRSCRFQDLSQFVYCNGRSSEQVHGLLLFSRGCCQVLLKSAQCAMPSLTFCRCNCIVLEIRSKRCISLERIHGQAVNCTTRQVFFRLSHLRRQRKSRHMKIWGDCSLIIDVLFSEPDTTCKQPLRKRHCITVAWVAYDEFITAYCMFQAIHRAVTVSVPVSNNFLTLICRHQR